MCPSCGALLERSRVSSFIFSVGVTAGVFTALALQSGAIFVISVVVSWVLIAFLPLKTEANDPLAYSSRLRRSARSGSKDSP